jgi:uncharacterized protein YbaA (DUF1428 family)
MYVAGLVIPVPEDRMEDYRRWAENGAKIFKDYGCLEIVECWEDFVPDGKHTDFRRAVAAKPGEKIVFTWQVWPDKESFWAAEAAMHKDARLDSAGEPPFDAKRLILGCFAPVFTMGRD